ncbi:MAG: DUF421 domain-containing protein [Thermoleophilia bacterium]|nr:DUF421 domain-containing protein [Thermoleophilia bacterium]
MFFDGWSDLGRVAVTAVLAYAGLVVLVRLSGKRALSQLNAFDWIVTVAYGSTLATTILSPDVTLAAGLTALATLSALQYAVTSVASRSKRAARLVKNEPALVVHRGAILRDALRRERLSEEDVLQALRSHGVGSLDEVDSVIIETDGSLAVVAESRLRGSVLDDVGAPADDGP